MLPLQPIVLISDDEPLLVAALNREAKRLGLRVIADTSSDVFALAIEHHPDVIVLDIHQHVDGRDLLSRLKQDARTKNTPVIVLSAVEDQFTRHVCFELGAADYEVKPFDPSFMRKLARVANRDVDEAAVH